MGRIRIALVDDYEVVVAGLAAMLRSYYDRVDIVELDANTDVAEPVDVALFDTFANVHEERHEVGRLVANPLVAHVVVYSWNLDPELVEQAMAEGASGYLSKQLPASELVAALERVARGQHQVSRATSDRVQAVAGDWPGREEGLTSREAEVLAFITQGLTNDQIAVRTHLSINSVKTYIRSAYRRIGVTDRANAILWGIDHGFRPTARRDHP